MLKRRRRKRFRGKKKVLYKLNKESKREREGERLERK